jgi:hypothetical protein
MTLNFERETLNRRHAQNFKPASDAGPALHLVVIATNFTNEKITESTARRQNYSQIYDFK